MKNNFSEIGLGKICSWFGISRQAYYTNAWKEERNSIEEEVIVKEVHRIRNEHPRMGGRKLYSILNPVMNEHQIKMGRDKFFDLLYRHNLLIRRKRRGIKTTFSNHWMRKYPNLIKHFTPTAPNQLWVSDITYWKVNGITMYLTFITDAYSHRIVGYHLTRSLEAVECIKALQMALSTLKAESHLHLIHHSDRGSQYCSSEYVELLKKHGIQISMTESGDPLENSIAERINGIIKGEYLEASNIKTVKDAMNYLPKAISLYNTKRPHMSISNYTPDSVHYAEESFEVKRLWKNYYKKNNSLINEHQNSN